MKFNFRIFIMFLTVYMSVSALAITTAAGFVDVTQVPLSSKILTIVVPAMMALAKTLTWRA